MEPGARAGDYPNAALGKSFNGRHADNCIWKASGNREFLDAPIGRRLYRKTGESGDIRMFRGAIDQVLRRGTTTPDNIDRVGRHRGRKVGKAITSRIDGLSVNSMTSRSMPMPSPPQGGSPYSSAVT
jgi:hypothetical protein